MSKLGSIVLPPELCRQISRQLSELLNYTVVCKYDESENLFYVQIFNVVFDRFDEVEPKVFDYSNANYGRLGAFCIPVMFTPEQTRDCFPGAIWRGSGSGRGVDIERGSGSGSGSGNEGGTEAEEEAE